MELMDSAIDIHEPRLPELFNSIIDNNSFSVHELIEAGVDVNATGRAGTSPLHCAAECKGTDATNIVQLLLDAGARICAQDMNGATSLHVAASKGNTAIMRLLLSKLSDQGGSIDAMDFAMCTSLYKACEKGHAEVAELLLDSGADIYAADKWDTTPLHVAADTAYTSVVKLLLSREVAVDYEVDAVISSPLMRAVHRGCEASVKLLLEAGAILDDDEHYAEVWAKKRGFHGIVHMICNERLRRRRWSKLRASWIALLCYTECL